VGCYRTIANDELGLVAVQDLRLVKRLINGHGLYVKAMATNLGRGFASNVYILAV
jgi:hypothetical protein